MAACDTITSAAVIASSTIGLPAMDGAYFLMFLGAVWLIFQLVIAFFRVKEFIFPQPNPPASEKFRHADECERRCAVNLAGHDKLDREFRAEIAKVEMRIKSFEAEIRKSLEDLDNKSEQRALKMHGRTNEILAAVSRLQGKLEK